MKRTHILTTVLAAATSLVLGTGIAVAATSEDLTAQSTTTSTSSTATADEETTEDISTPLGPVVCPAGSETPSAPQVTASTAPGSTSTVVTFVVPPITWVRLGADGTVTAVMTNTRETPACTDLFVEEGGGALDAVTRQHVLDLRLEGEFEPGEWRTLSR